MPVRLVISICHPLLLVSCNDRRGVDYATTLTQALLQVLARYTICSVFFQFPRLNSHSHVLTSHSHPIPIPWLILLPFPWESHGTHGIPVFPIPMHTSSLNSHSHALNSHSHPIPIPWLILHPFPWESHGTHGIPVFPIPMHTSREGRKGRGGEGTGGEERRGWEGGSSSFALVRKITCWRLCASPIRRRVAGSSWFRSVQFSSVRLL